MSCMAKKSRPLSDEALVLVARRFAVLSEPMRLRLLHALLGGEKHVNALVEATEGTQANVGSTKSSRSSSRIGQTRRP